MAVCVGGTSWTLAAHAIVSREGFIADADGTMPPGLHVPEDQARFRAALAAADVTILGREGHERHPQEDRRRLVLTTRASGVEACRGGAAVFWNPSTAPLERALAAFGLDGPGPDGSAREAVVAGGTRVMTALLPHTDRFDLAVADCSIAQGRPCLEGTASVEGIERRLREAGLVALPHEQLGSAQLRPWRREP